MKRALAWLKRRWKLLLVGVGLLLGVEIVRRGRILRTLRDELGLARARARVGELAAVRAALEVDAEKNAAAILSLDEAIREHRVAAVRAYEEGAALTGAELERAFEELGF